MSHPHPLRKPSQPLARPTAVSSPRPPFKWRGSIPASPAFDLPPRIRLVVRSDTGRGVFSFYGFHVQLLPSLPRSSAHRSEPAHRTGLRTVLHHEGPIPDPLRTVPAPFALSLHFPPSGFIPRRALWKWAQSVSRTFAFEVRAPSARGINKKTSGVRSLGRGCLGSGMPP